MTRLACAAQVVIPRRTVQIEAARQQFVDREAAAVGKLEAADGRAVEHVVAVEAVGRSLVAVVDVDHVANLS